MRMERMRRWGFGAGTAAALAFGGAQAVAAPAPADEGNVCNAQLCNRICQSIPGSIGGFCAPDGSCQCYIGG
jgi:hypothetical protein